jgi:hypothetical protein
VKGQFSVAILNYWGVDGVGQLCQLCSVSVVSGFWPIANWDMEEISWIDWESWGVPHTLWFFSLTRDTGLDLGLWPGTALQSAAAAATAAPPVIAEWPLQHATSTAPPAAPVSVLETAAATSPSTETAGTATAGPVSTPLANKAEWPLQHRLNGPVIRSLSWWAVIAVGLQQKAGHSAWGNHPWLDVIDSTFWGMRADPWWSSDPVIPNWQRQSCANHQRGFTVQTACSNYLGSKHHPISITSNRARQFEQWPCAV